MKFPYRIRPNPAGKKSLTHTTNQVLAVVVFAVGYWLQLDDPEKVQILASLGLSAEHLALYTLIGTVAAFALAKNTSIQRVDNSPPEQLQGDPDHGEADQ